METILNDPEETVDNPNRLAQSDQKRLDRTDQDRRSSFDSLDSSSSAVSLGIMSNAFSGFSVESEGHC
eukprot:scaffold3602_cov66-Cyclotella_meneghiniana.AAC.3